MLKIASVVGVLAAATAASQAAAGSWSVGVGVGFGGPAYYDPPIYYEDPPIYYGAPPPYVYEQPPVIYAPAPPPPVLRSSLSPDAVFDALERAGYREFSPMAFREGVYKLNATNRRGDIDGVRAAALDGEVEREFILRRGHHSARVAKPAPSLSPAPLPRPAPEPSGASGDPLVVY